MDDIKSSGIVDQCHNICSGRWAFTAPIPLFLVNILKRQPLSSVRIAIAAARELVILTVITLRRILDHFTKAVKLEVTAVQKRFL